VILSSLREGKEETGSEGGKKEGNKKQGDRSSCCFWTFHVVVGKKLILV